MHLAQHTELEDHDRVEAWRLQQLLNAGLTFHRAAQLAARSDVDLHHALALLQRGCDERTLLRILL